MPVEQRHFRRAAPPLCCDDGLCHNNGPPEHAKLRTTAQRLLKFAPSGRCPEGIRPGKKKGWRFPSRIYMPSLVPRDSSRQSQTAVCAGFPGKCQGSRMLWQNVSLSKCVCFSRVSMHRSFSFPRPFNSIRTYMDEEHSLEDHLP